MVGLFCQIGSYFGTVSFGWVFALEDRVDASHDWLWAVSGEL